MTAEEVLLLGKDDLEKVFDEVNSHLENCIEKLLVIKVQLLSEQEGNGSECNHSKLGTNNYLAAKDGDEDKEENEGENEGEREGVVRRMEGRKRVGGEGTDVDSNHAIQGNSSMRSSPFPSSAITHPSRHCNDEEEERPEVEQKNHGDHYCLEGLKQKGGGGGGGDSLSTTETAGNSSYNSQLPPSLFAGDPNREVFSQSGRQGIKSSSKDSSSFEEHKYVIRNSEFEESDENPSSYVVNVKKPSLTIGKPPIGSSRMSGTVEYQPEKVMRKGNSSDGNESNPDTIPDQKDVVPTFMMKSYSNEEIVFRMADERAHQQLGHVPQEHNWTDYSARLSLPSLDPPANFRDHASTHELAPACMHRTPELVNITKNKSTDGDGVMNDGQVSSINKSSTNLETRFK